MPKAKKKSKDRLPKPIKVKKEKTEEDRSLHAMSHYLDDRLELVKQVFAALKPKTITNLAPEFLKKKSMVHIEELCLNELMCISTKRLLSIINATKCPTDTESEEDSDVQPQEEHVSLEEISSDSEMETNAAKNKSSGSRKAKKDTKRAVESQGAKASGSGPISVLELLELQARARAIRSQLALEPVTKIEVDSEEEEEEAKNKANKPAAAKDHRERTNRRRKSIERERAKASAAAAAAKASAAAEANKAATQQQQASQKVKLKRNYRNANQEAVAAASEVALVVPPRAANGAESASDLKRELGSRSASPDVIQIVAEPETLLISDSDSDEPSKASNAASASKPAEVVAEKPRERAISEETEEGEITESEAEKVEEAPPAAAATAILESELQQAAVADALPPLKETEVEADSKQTETKPNSTEQEALPTNVEENFVDASSSQQDPEAAKESVTNLAAFADDDDVISIGGDLESEMSQHLVEDSSSTFAATTANHDADTASRQNIITLDSSDEGGKKTPGDSWHARYLKSSKVSKVLATSRLGKRVRDKIKKSKRSKRDEDAAVAIVVAQKPKEVFTSRHEDGSVEQYKELLELRQRKS